MTFPGCSDSRGRASRRGSLGVRRRALSALVTALAAVSFSARAVDFVVRDIRVEGVQRT